VIRVISIVFLLFIGNSSFAQGETWNWCFGDSAGIKFINGKIPVAVTTYKDWGYEGTSVLSNKDGNLQYYAFNYNLFDSTNKRLNKGFSLLGEGSSCQPVQLIRHKKGKTLHIFTTWAYFPPWPDYTGFHYSTFDTGFSIKNKMLIQNIGEKQTNYFHQNNNDIWITTHSAPNDTFYSFLVTKDGLIECPVINKIGASYTDKYPSQGSLKFSPSGKYCFNPNWDLNRIELYRYDKENSKLYDLVTIVQSWAGEVEFSPDEKFFYFVDRGDHIYQLSLKNWNKDSIEKSRKLIATTNGETFGQLQLGPDKKIYVALYRQGYIGRIEDPNNYDTACHYKNNFLYLGGRTSEAGFPNFNASYFHTPSADYSYEQDCRTNTITFEGKDTFKANSHAWLFKKGSTLDSKTGKNVSYTFSDTGKWNVSYVAAISGRIDTVTKTITIRPKLEKGFLGSDKQYCNTIPTLHAPKNLHCIHWYNDTLMELGKVDSIKVSKEGTYYAKATNRSFCVEWDTIKISKRSLPKPDFSVSDVCESDSAVFINKSKGAVSYKWKFGDGNSSNKENPKHLFKIITTSTFNVTLVAIENDECKDSIVKPVTVNKSPNSSFTYSRHGQVVDLKATETGFTKYHWKFGTTDSVTVTTANHSYTVKSSDQNKMCLTVIDILGCKSQTCRDVTVGINLPLNPYEINIYPNPSKGKITVNVNQPGFHSIKVFNETGQLIMEKEIKGNQSENLNINSGKGLYLIEVRNKKGNYAYKKVLVE
jgi:hypothetical protein